MITLLLVFQLIDAFSSSEIDSTAIGYERFIYTLSVEISCFLSATSDELLIKTSTLKHSIAFRTDSTLRLCLHTVPRS